MSQPPRSLAPAPSPNPPPPSSTASAPSPASSSGGGPGGGAAPKPKKPRRSKVAEACRFCRRSHMSCDAGRPCSRCVKRDIAHLCRDEPLPTTVGAAGGGATGAAATATPPAPPTPVAAKVTKTSTPAPQVVPHQDNTLGLDLGGGSGGTRPGNNNSNSLVGVSTAGLLGGVSSPAGMGGGGMTLALPQQQQHQPMSVGMPFASPSNGGYGSDPMLTSNFNLAMLDLASGQDGMGADLGLDMTSGGEQSSEFHGLGLSEFLQSLNDSPFLTDPTGLGGPLPTNSEAGLNEDGGAPLGRRETNPIGSAGHSVPGSPINKTERFLLTAADQKDGSRSDRLARVIHAKFEAGLLRPYNHVAGYTRLMRWMADNMSQSSRQRTLHILSEFRPAFRAIASGLTDLDLVFIEEAFERLLLDYDRVFSSMGIPSCLWRRTGEIYKGNKEFAALVGVPIEQLQGGKLAIYELMAEESAVNYWEKYGDIAFDAGQKAVLTSCVLVNQSVLSRKRKKSGGDKVKQREDAMINCCFSFTIRRDSYAIPSMIVGNFLRF